MAFRRVKPQLPPRWDEGYRAAELARVSAPAPGAIQPSRESWLFEQGTFDPIPEPEHELDAPAGFLPPVPEPSIAEPSAPESPDFPAQSASVADDTVEALKLKLRSLSYGAQGQAGGSWGQNPRKLFSHFDRDNSGRLDYSEFESAVRKGGKLTQASISEAGLRKLFRSVDEDGSGDVSIEELAAFVWGPKKERKRRSHDSLLRAAAKAGDVHTVRALIGKGKADTNKTDHRGQTPLLLAALKGHELVVAALIEGGAQVDKENSVSGFTPLMNAAFFGRAVVLRWLLAAGANSGRANKGGRTALTLARLWGKTAATELLGAWEASTEEQRTKLIGDWGLLHVRERRRRALDASLPAVEFDASLGARPWTGADSDGGRPQTSDLSYFTTHVR